MSDLELLLEKVRTAEAGSRELDLYLHARVAQRGEWADGDIRYALTDVEGTTAPPHYTTSIDAIVALIERELPDYEWLRKSAGTMTVYRRLTPEQDAGKEWAVHIVERGATTALALCAAFLSALISREKSDG